MPTALSSDPVLETEVLWLKYKKVLGLLLAALLLMALGFGAHQVYHSRRNANAAAELAAAKDAKDYERITTVYSGTAAAGSARLLWAQAQREKKLFAEANANLEAFTKENPNHELLSTAELGVAANLESMGKTDDALARYKRIAVAYPKSFTAPLALFSQVPLLKGKNQTDEARRVCETILTQYRESLWATQAMVELRAMKPTAVAAPAPPGAATPTSGASPAVRPPMAAPPAAVPPSGPVPSATATAKPKKK
jgi:predicted negative regulator of RcsB-dependent stress response